MRYPSVNSYITALGNPKLNCRSLKRVKLRLTSDGNPIFRVSSSYLSVLVELGGEARILCLFTNQHHGDLPLGEYLKDEIMALVDGRMSYWDLVVEHGEAKVLNGGSGGEQQILSLDQEVESREQRVPFEENGLWGFKHEDGEVVVEAKYSRVGGFYEGRSEVEYNGYEGLIDRDGREVIEPIYDDLSYDNSSYCYVNKMGRCGVLDRSGIEVVECRWDWIGEISEGMFLVERDGLYGYLNKDGEVVIEPQFKDAASFKPGGYARVSRDGERSFVINREGKRV